MNEQISCYCPFKLIGHACCVKYRQQSKGFVFAKYMNRITAYKSLPPPHTSNVTGYLHNYWCILRGCIHFDERHVSCWGSWWSNEGNFTRIKVSIQKESLKLNRKVIINQYQKYSKNYKIVNYKMSSFEQSYLLFEREKEKRKKHCCTNCDLWKNLKINFPLL